MSSENDHIVGGFDKDLNRISTDLQALGDLVLLMTEDAVKSIKKRDSDLAKSVIERDKLANALQAKIDEESLRIMALRHPMAQDLRGVIGAIRIANDLERVGDLAEGIAKRALHINEQNKIPLTKSVVRMGKIVKKQLSRTLATINNDDLGRMTELWKSDEDIDDSYNGLFRELLTYMIEDPQTIEACTGLLFVAKNLERIGDHAANICESVYFTATGAPLIDDPVIEDYFNSETDAV